MFDTLKLISISDILKINELGLLKDEPFAVVDKNRIYSAFGNQIQPYPNKEQALQACINH